MEAIAAGPVRTSAGWLQAGAGLGAVAGVLLLSARSEAVDQLRFPLAWAGVLCALDGAVRARRGRSPLVGPGDWAMAAAASVLFWDLFELLNLRLHDWWYTGLSPRWWAGGLFSALSFATVLPAVALGEALLRPAWDAAPTAGPPLAERRARPRLLFAAGAGALGLAVAFPRVCFPLAWLFLWPLAEGLLLLLEPRPEGAPASPLEALRGGDRGPLLRLLAFGIPLGLVWEGLNAGCARGWVYTVPFFEETKLFEMPLAGYLGYPPFLLEAGALLALAGRLRARLSRRPLEAPALLAAVALLGAMHLGCDALGRARSAASFALDLAEARHPEAEALARAGVRTPRAVLGAIAAEGAPALAARSGVGLAALLGLRDLCALAERTGMGLSRASELWAVGAGSPEALAALGPVELERLQARLAALGDPPDPALVRLWARKAAQVR